MIYTFLYILLSLGMINQNIYTSDVEEEEISDSARHVARSSVASSGLSRGTRKPALSEADQEFLEMAWTAREVLYPAKIKDAHATAVQVLLRAGTKRAREEEQEESDSESISPSEFEPEEDDSEFEAPIESSFESEEDNSKLQTKKIPLHKSTRARKPSAFKYSNASLPMKDRARIYFEKKAPILRAAPDRHQKLKVLEEILESLPATSFLNSFSKTLTRLRKTGHKEESEYEKFISKAQEKYTDTFPTRKIKKVVTMDSILNPESGEQLRLDLNIIIDRIFKDLMTPEQRARKAATKERYKAKHRKY